MSDPIELATQLGKAIAESPEAQKYRQAREALEAEGDLAQTFEAYHEQAEKVARLEAENKPVEVADKHKLQELNQTLVSAPTFKQFTAAQMDYVDLMRRVNQALSGELTPIEGAEDSDQ